MKKIVYYVSGDRFIKTFIPFKNMDSDNQYILIPEDFVGNLSTKNTIRYADSRHVFEIIKDIGPDVFVGCRYKTTYNDYCTKLGILNAVISHGICASNRYVIKNILRYEKVYRSFDLMCVSTQKQDKDPIINNVKGIRKDRVVVTSGLAQFDGLYESKIYKNTIKGPKKILFACGYAFLISKGGKKYIPRKEYFDNIKFLSKICSDNGWELFIKPRDNDYEFLANYNYNAPWCKEYIVLYEKLFRLPNIHFVDAYSNIYDHFDATAIVQDDYCLTEENSWSTLEIEACLAKIPIVTLASKKNFNSCHNIEKNGAILISKGAEDIYNVLMSLESEEMRLKVSMAQCNLTKDMGIIFDGNVHKRILEEINRL